MFFNKKSRRSDASEGASILWKLPKVTQCLRELLPPLESAEIEPALIEARLADHYRDAGRAPISHAKFDQLAKPLDTEAWRRLALAVGSLDHDDIRSVLAVAIPPSQQVALGFVGFARKTAALTLAIVRQSDIRVEELARHFAFHLGVGWHGETTEQSQARLQQIDYKRLLSEAEEAKKLAEDRMKALRIKQEEELARRRPRGKQ